MIRPCEEGWTLFCFLVPPPTLVVWGDRLSFPRGHFRVPVFWAIRLDEEVDGKIFNHYHASAAYHSLAILERRHGVRDKEKSHPVWSRLARRVQEMVEKDEVQPQTVANVLWSLGQLFSHRVTLRRNVICVFCLCSGAGEESFVFKKKHLQQFCNTFGNWIFSMVVFEQNNCVAIIKLILQRPEFFPPFQIAGEGV